VPVSDAVSQPATLRLSVSAQATASIHPHLYIGLFASVSTYATAEFYLRISPELYATAQFAFRTAIGATHVLSAIPSATCAAAVIGCNDACYATHDVRLNASVYGRITGAYKIYAQASWGGWDATTGIDSEVPFDLTAYNWDINLGSWCYFLFPPSPPPLSTTTAGSSDSSTTSDSQAIQTLVTTRFTLAVSPESFDQSAFVSLLRTQFPSVDDIRVSIISTDDGGRRLTETSTGTSPAASPGTVIVEVTFVASPSVATSISTAVTSTSPADVSSSWLGGLYTVTAVGVPTSTTSSPSATPPDDATSMGMIIGIVAGAAVVLLMVVVCCYMMMRATPSAVDESKPDAETSSTSVELSNVTVPVENTAGVDTTVAPAAAISVATAVVPKPARAPAGDVVA